MFSLDVLPDRFLDKIMFEPNTGCWLWTAARTTRGYGRFTVDTKRRTEAHTYAYTALVGPVPEGLELDHLCRVRHCVSPYHLEPVTHRTNILRGEARSAHNARKTHCQYGHPFDASNTYVWTLRGIPRRTCRTCNVRRSQDYLRRKRGAA